MIENIGNFACDVCGLKRTSQMYLNAHKSSIHGQDFQKLQYETSSGK